MDTFLKKINRFKKKIAFYDDSKIYTYNDLISKLDLFEKIIGERKLVLLFCENKYEIVFSYINLILTNSVIILADKNLSSKNIYNIVDTYKPDFIFNLKKKIKFSTTYEIFRFIENQIILKKKTKHNFKIYKNLSLLLPTSGSTGSPKYVRISNLNLIENTSQIIDSLQLNENHITITTMPFNYTYGMSIINTHLACGASIVLNNYSFLEKKFWELLKIRKVTNFGGVPFMYEMLSRVGFNRVLPKTILHLTQAGGKITEKLFQEIVEISKKKGFKFYSMYGQTETTSRMSVLNYRYADYKISSIGKPLKRGKFELIDDKNKIIKSSNVNGQLIYYGKNVSLGYSENIKDLSKGDKNKNKINTGDIAFRDSEGFFFISGRKKRFCKLFGVRISLDEVEYILNQLNLNSAAISDDKILYLFFEKNIDKSFVINKIVESVGLNKFYVKTIFPHKLPRKSSGKISYNELEEYVKKL